MTHLHKRKGFLGQQGTLALAPDVAAALGELTARWALLEYDLMRVAAHVSGMSEEEASAVMYAVNATSARLDIVRALAERLPDTDPRRSAAIKAVAECVKLCGKRNALVHHSWAVDAIRGYAYTFDFRAEPNTQARRIRRTAKSILLFCDEVADAYRWLAEASGEVVDDTFAAAFKTASATLLERMSAKG
jgi:hypothetical protein